MGDEAGKLYLFTSLYHNMLFFFVAGFFFEEATGGNEYLRRLCKIIYRVAIPTVLFIVINTIFFSVRGESSVGNTISILKAYFAMKKGSGIGGIWFLGCFFFVSILHLSVSYIIKNKYIVFILSLISYCFANLADYSNILFLNARLFASIDLIPQFWIYYAFGSIVFPLLQKIEASSTLQNRILRITLFLLSCMYSMICYFKGTYCHIGNAFCFNFIGSVTIMLFFVVVTQYIAKALDQNSIVLKIGRATFILCATEHMTRPIVGDFFSSFGLILKVISPISAILLSTLYLLIGYLLWFKYVAGIFPILSGHYTLQNKHKS